MVVGVEHPVLRFNGNLPLKATELVATCPPGCIHVSNAFVKKLGECILSLARITRNTSHIKHHALRTTHHNHASHSTRQQLRSKELGECIRSSLHMSNALPHA